MLCIRFLDTFLGSCQFSWGDCVGDYCSGDLMWVWADEIDDSDYDVFLSPLEDFKKAMEEAGLGDKAVYLDRKDAYRFRVKEEK